MRVAIQQPQYISWIGYFNKIARSDLFVYFDDCQYEDRGFQNRNLVLNHGKLRWLTIPVKGKKRINIDEIKIDNREGWRRKHLDILRLNYSNFFYFGSNWDKINQIYSKRFLKLVDFIIDLDDVICGILDIKTKRIRSSQLGIRGVESTKKLVAICKKVGADVYLSGSGGIQYMQPSEFRKNNINVEWQKLTGKYISQKENPSILDFLFRYGEEEVKKIIKKVY